MNRWSFHLLVQMIYLYTENRNVFIFCDLIQTWQTNAYFSNTMQLLILPHKIPTSLYLYIYTPISFYTMFKIRSGFLSISLGGGEREACGLFELEFSLSCI